eukprot:Awhi_evm4s1128
MDIIVEKVCNLYENYAYNYNTWCEMVWIIKNTWKMSGEDEDDWRDILLHYSKKKGGNKFDRKDTIKKWEEADENGNITVGSMIFLIEQSMGKKKCDNWRIENNLMNIKIKEDVKIIDIPEVFSTIINEDGSEDSIAAMFLHFNDNLVFCEDEIYLYNEETYLWDKPRKTKLQNYIDKNCKKYFNDYKDDLSNNLSEYERKIVAAGIKKARGKLNSYSMMSKVVDSVKGKINNEITTFNKNIYLLPLLNKKVINLETLEVRDRIKTDYFNFECNVNYTPGCTTEHIEDFMNKICLEDEDLIQYMRLINAYFLTGSMTDRSFYIETGTGRNGKSALNGLRQKMMGAFLKDLDQAVVVKRPNSSAGSATSHLIPLCKARLGVVCEVGEDEVMNDTLLKTITGGDNVPMRDLFEKSGEEKSRKIQARIVIQTNNIPEFRKNQRAVLDRIKVIPFNARFERKQDYKKGMKDTYIADSTVIDSLMNEYLDECFTYFVMKCPDVFKNKTIQEPQICKDKLNSVLDEMNPLRELFEVEYDITNNDKDSILKQDLYESIKYYTKTNNMRPMKNKDIKYELTTRGLYEGRTTINKIKAYRIFGVKLIQQQHTEEEDYVECE